MYFGSSDEGGPSSASLSAQKLKMNKTVNEERHKNIEDMKIIYDYILPKSLS